jgi:hypothetical protein
MGFVIDPNKWAFLRRFKEGETASKGCIAIQFYKDETGEEMVVEVPVKHTADVFVSKGGQAVLVIEIPDEGRLPWVGR